MKYLPLLLILFSCNMVHESYIQPELRKYYDQFFIEAQLRGVDLPDKETIIQFGTPSKWDRQGEAEHGKTWDKIVIRKSFYDEHINNCESCIEMLVFHELGHGILNRNHYNEVRDSLVFTGSIIGIDTLNSSWMTIGIPVSIMHAGNLGSGDAGGYYQKNRNYYLNELFGVN